MSNDECLMRNGVLCACLKWLMGNYLIYKKLNPKFNIIYHRGYFLPKSAGFSPQNSVSHLMILLGNLLFFNQAIPRSTN
jgi:hypothetical protein